MPCYDALMPWELQEELQVQVLNNNRGAVRDLVARLSETYLDSQDRAGRTPLFNACRLGYTEIASQLLKAGTDMNITDDACDTPLTSACFHGHYDIVRALCLAGADPTMGGCNGSTPYNRALEGNQPHAAEIVKVFETLWRSRFVFQAEAKKRAMTCKVEVSKRQALSQQFVEELRITNKLINSRELDALMPDDDSDDGSVVRFTKDEVARIGTAKTSVQTWSKDVSSISDSASVSHHVSPLLAPHTAASSYEEEEEEYSEDNVLPVAKRAVSVISCDVVSAVPEVQEQEVAPQAWVRAQHTVSDQTSCYERGSQAPPPSPVASQHVSVCSGVVPVAQSVVSHSVARSVPPVVARSVASSAPVVPTPAPASTATVASAPASQKDSAAYQILCAAAHRGELQTCMRLAPRVPLERVDDSSHTPLVWAVVGGHVHVVRWLLSEGVDATRRDSCGYTPLFHAVQHGKDEMVALLGQLGHGLVHAEDNEGHNLVQWAAFSGSTSTLRLLVERFRVGVDVLDKDGKSALHWAALKGNTTAVQYLLPRCAVSLPFQKDANGNTAEDQARLGAHLKTAEVLRTHCVTLSQPQRLI